MSWYKEYRSVRKEIVNKIVLFIIRKRASQGMKKQLFQIIVP